MTEPLRQTPPTPSPADFVPAVHRLRAALPHPLRGALRSGADLVRQRREAGETAPLQTAVPVLDRLLGGGLPRGRLVEMLGGKSGGRFALVLAALAAATAAGEVAALVDLGDQLDPQGAAAAGVDLERLLWLRPERIADALAAAEMAVAGGFPLVVLDLGVPPLAGGRGAEPFWVRLGRAAETHGTALLVSTPYRVSGTAAGAVLQLARGRGVWAGRDGRRAPAFAGGAPALLAGVAGEVTLEKLRGAAAEGRREPLALRPPDDPLAATPLHRVADRPATAGAAARSHAAGEAVDETAPERRHAEPRRSAAAPAATGPHRFRALRAAPDGEAPERRRAAAGGG
jgi:hypothetical protein